MDKDVYTLAIFLLDAYIREMYSDSISHGVHPCRQAFRFSSLLRLLGSLGRPVSEVHAYQPRGIKPMLIESLFVSAVCVGITVCIVLLVTALFIGEEL